MAYYQTIRLVRAIDEPGHDGPRNGQWALQRALRAVAPGWLQIGGSPGPDEIPWFWCWADRQAAARRAVAGRPFVVGPNVLFNSSRHPGRVPAERTICNAASCQLMFTESVWYRELIERFRGSGNRAPIVLWPYPIEPKPGGPLAAEHDLLIYCKSGYAEDMVGRIQRELPEVCRIRYGQYRREELFAAARRSRCCLYLSDDDRGPLALAEILLAGCPTVGIPRGVPFVQNGATGIVIERFTLRACLEAVRECHRLDRRRVAAATAEQFDTRRTVATILAALAKVAVRD